MRLAGFAGLAGLAGLAGVVGVLVGGCEDPEPTDEPFFPEDYGQSYVEVRDCRGSGDHDLNNIRILASPTALGPYQDRDRPFPEGALVLKEEYDFGDLDCTGPVVQWTVMQRVAEGSAPDLLDWNWQRVDAGYKVLDTDTPRCINCHTGCGAAPDGYQGTCAVP